MIDNNCINFTILYTRIYYAPQAFKNFKLLFLKEHRPTSLKSSCPRATGCPIKRIDRLSVNVTLPLSLDRSCICRRRFLQCSLLDKLRRNQIHTCLQCAYCRRSYVQRNSTTSLYTVYASLLLI